MLEIIDDFQCSRLIQVTAGCSKQNDTERTTNLQSKRLAKCSRGSVIGDEQISVDLLSKSECLSLARIENLSPHPLPRELQTLRRWLSCLQPWRESIRQKSWSVTL